ncbi:hypothetical protein [uncultured Duncaniella sp.]|uniref:gp53-like domain-containing protein n=4 Tax=Muribaculaceae TaxID=2005473 RepID=UPI0025AA2E54|nr:hypothetical protein [uncultured Duncaniella sp.]
MAIRTIAQLKAWFRRGKYPTEEQFADWLDSYVHKEESIIPVIQVEGLAEQLNSKYVASEGHELERQHIELKGDYETHRKTSDERFDNISGCIEDLETENERQQTEIDSLNAEVEVIHTKDSSQDKEISALHDTDRDQQMSIDSLDGRADTLEQGIRMHVSDTDNPHRVDKSQVGLGNVPNVATNDQTPTYTVAPSLTDLSSGEKLSSAFGKLMKAVSSLISHISSRDNPHQVTATQVGASPSGHNHDSTYQPKGNYAPATHTHTAAQVNEDASHRFVTDAEKSTWNSKAGGSHNHDSTYQPKGNYAPATHTHTAAQVTGDASHRFVTDAEKSAWNSKADGSHNHDSVYQPKGDYLLSSQLQDLKGDKGDKGDKGAVFTPVVDSSGNLTWSNNGGLTNPAAVNIRGPKGSDATVTKAAIEAVLTGVINSHKHEALSKRLVENGYYRFHDGFLIQWGHPSDNQDAYGVQTIYFPHSFVDTSYSILTTADSSYQTYYVGRTICNKSAGSFKVSANQKNKERFFWIAVGKG